MHKSKDRAHSRRIVLSERQYRKLAAMGKISTGLISELSNPIDAINRFINLALQSIGEDPQIRQFLIESKHGIIKTAVLLNRLNHYAKKIQKEINIIENVERDNTNIISK